MNRLLNACAILAAGGLTASAQGVYTNAASPKDNVCPLVQRDKTALNFGAASRNPSQDPTKSDNPVNGQVLSSTGGMAGADAMGKSFYEEGDHYFPQGQRKDVSLFTVYDAKGQSLSVASQKGRIVLVGLWSTHCDPSARMLMEMANIYPKAAQFGFQVMAVNFDLNQQDAGDGGIEGGWRAINKFMIRNRQFFEASKMPVYTPGLGKEGASNFMDIVQSLPALFVIDREGRLASIRIGYKDGFVGEALKRVLMEKPSAPAPAPAR